MSCRANSILLRNMKKLSYFLLGPLEKEIQSKCSIGLGDVEEIAIQIQNKDRHGFVKVT